MSDTCAIRERGAAYCVRPVFSVVEVCHAVNARKGGGRAAVTMGVELLLGQDVSTGLRQGQTVRQLPSISPGIDIGHHRDQDRDPYLAGEGDHFVVVQGGA